MDRTVLRAVLINVIRDVIMLMEAVLVPLDLQANNVKNVSIPKNVLKNNIIYRLKT